MMSEKLLRMPQVLDRLPFGRSTLYARIADGRFPRPLHVGPRIAAWPESQIDAAIEAMIAEAEADEGA